MNGQYDYDIIRDYLHGLLDRETAREVGNLIKKDETAKSIAEGILRLEREFKENDRDMESYLENFRQAQLKIIDHQTKVASVTKKYWFKVAATLLVIVAAGFVIRMMVAQPDLNSLLEEELSKPYPASTIFRSREAVSEKERAYALYATGNYAMASHYFEKAASSEGENHASLTFYNALCYLYRDDFARAIELLESHTIAESRYTQQARWYRSLALIRLKNKDQAVEILRVIKNDPQHFKHDAALAIFDALQ